MTTDNMIHAICQTEDGFSLRQIQYDESLTSSLQKRKIQIENKDLIIVPIRDDESKIAGSIEIYIRAVGTASKEERNFEFYNYWIQVFEKYAAIVGFAMKNFMVAMINNLSI